MRYEQRIIAFIDILGFKNVIEKTVNNDGTDNEEKIDELVQALQEIQLCTNHHGLSRKTTHFSDSIVISFSIEDNKETNFSAILYDLHSAIHILIWHDLLCRGAIVYGKLIHCSNLLFGPAIIDAYEQEKKEAQYPRIILQEAVIEKIAKKNSYVKKYVRIDEEDNKYYLDYLESTFLESIESEDFEYCFLFFSKVAEIIKKGLQENNKNIKRKYVWMAEKYNKVLKNMQQTVNKNELLPELQDIFFAYNLFIYSNDP